MQTPADIKTTVQPQAAPPTATPPTGAIPPRPVAPSAPAASKPQSPLASLVPTTPSAGPQKRRLIAGAVVAGSVLALGLFSGTKSPEELPVADLTEPKAADETPDQLTTLTAAEPAGRPVVIHTDRPVATTLVDDLEWEDAREIASSEVGSDGFFTWQGQLHSTTTHEEFDNKTEEEKADFVGDLTWHENHDAGQIVEVNGVDMEVVAPYLEKVGEWSVFKHTDGGEDKYYLGDANGDGRPLENISQDIWGNLVRTDPETGEVTPFNPTVMLDDAADGKVDMQFFPSDVEVVNGIPSVEPVVAILFDPSAEYADPYPPVDDTPAVPAVEQVMEEVRSEADLLSDKLHSIAEEAGIDDVKKIKLDRDGDGWNYKVKGEDGEKLKGHLSLADVQAGAQPVASQAALPSVPGGPPQSDLVGEEQPAYEETTSYGMPPDDPYMPLDQPDSDNIQHEVI